MYQQPASRQYPPQYPPYQPPPPSTTHQQPPPHSQYPPPPPLPHQQQQYPVSNGNQYPPPSQQPQNSQAQQFLSQFNAPPSQPASQQQQPAYSAQPPPIPQQQRPAQTPASLPSASQQQRPAASRPTSNSKPQQRSSRPSPGKPSSNSKHAAPTPAATSNNEPRKPKSQFLIDLDYITSLPTVPFEPKLLHLHLDDRYLLRYGAANLEQHTKHDYYVSPTVNVDIDLIQTEQYARPPDVKVNDIDPADLALFSADIIGNKMMSASNNRVVPSNKALLQHNTFTWLKKDVYLSNTKDVSLSGSGGGSTAVTAESIAEKYRKPTATEAQRAAAAQAAGADVAAEDIARQIDEIELSFKLAQSAPRHPTKKHLTAKSITPIYPSDTLEQKQQYTWYEFDQDPLRHAASKDENGDVSPTQQDGSVALIQTYENEHHGLYLRSADDTKLPSSLRSLTHAAIRAKRQYEWRREYTKLPTPEVHTDNNFFLYYAPDGHAYYARYSDRIRLSKRSVPVKNGVLTAVGTETLEQIRTRPKSIAIVLTTDETSVAKVKSQLSASRSRQDDNDEEDDSTSPKRQRTDDDDNDAMGVADDDDNDEDGNESPASARKGSNDQDDDDEAEGSISD